MERKLINIDLLLEKLENKYGIEFRTEWFSFGSYNFMFIHRCNYLYVWMDDYDGWDNFGGEDNDLFVDFEIHGKNQEDYKDGSNNLLFLSNSIKEKYYYEYKGIRYIEYNQLKDWIVFQNDININEVTEVATINYSTDMSINLTNYEIDFIIEQIKNSNMPELIEKFNITQKLINNKLKNKTLHELNFTSIKPLKNIIKSQVNPSIVSNIENLENDDGVFEL